MTYAKLRFDAPFSCVQMKKKKKNSYVLARTRDQLRSFLRKNNAQPERVFANEIGRGPFQLKAIINLLIVLHRREASRSFIQTWTSDV